jgi:NTE family protein
VPTGWADHPAHWIVACDYTTGRRTPFGREGSQPADLADAVAASCAVPALYYPVEIGGRRYVDGGIYSASNLDLLRDEGLDLVICLNPTSSLHPVRALNPQEWPSLLFRRASGRRLGSETKRLRASGTEVVLIQPIGEDLDVISRNLMSNRNRNRVIDTARRTVAAQLQAPEVQELLAELPPGDERRVRRPEGDPSSWPGLEEMRSAI